MTLPNHPDAPVSTRRRRLIGMVLLAMALGAGMFFLPSRADSRFVGDWVLAPESGVVDPGHLVTFSRDGTGALSHVAADGTRLSSQPFRWWVSNDQIHGRPLRTSTYPSRLVVLLDEFEKRWQGLMGKPSLANEKMYSIDDSGPQLRLHFGSGGRRVLGRKVDLQTERPVTESPAAS